MQSKGLNPRILYPARLSFKIEGGTRSFTDKKRAKRVYHYQASNARNAKGTAVKKKRKARRNTNTKGKYDNKPVLINSNIKRKWIKCTSKKT